MTLTRLLRTIRRAFIRSNRMTRPYLTYLLPTKYTSTTRLSRLRLRLVKHGFSFFRFLRGPHLIVFIRTLINVNRPWLTRHFRHLFTTSENSSPSRVGGRIFCRVLFLFSRRRILRQNEVKDLGFRPFTHGQIMRTRLRNIRYRASRQINFTTMAHVARRQVTRQLRIRTGLILTSHFRLRLRRQVTINPLSNTMIHSKRLTSIICQQKTSMRLTINGPKTCNTLIFLRITRSSKRMTTIMRSIIPIITRHILHLFVLNVRRSTQNFTIRAIRRRSTIITIHTLRMLVRGILYNTFLLIINDRKRRSFLLLRRSRVNVLMRGLRRKITRLILILFATRLRLRTQLRKGIMLHLSIIIRRRRTINRRNFCTHTTSTIRLLRGRLRRFHQFVSQVSYVFNYNAQSETSTIITEIVSYRFITSIGD